MIALCDPCATWNIGAGAESHRAGHERGRGRRRKGRASVVVVLGWQQRGASVLRRYTNPLADPQPVQAVLTSMH